MADVFPAADILTMTAAQILVLDRMGDGIGYPFRDIAADCGISEKETRAIVRQFHAWGLTGYGPLYSEDGPAICGKGYWLRKPGWELQNDVRRHLGWRQIEALRGGQWQQAA